MPAKCLAVMTCFKRANSWKKQNLPQIISHFETNVNHMAFWQADAFCWGPAHAAQLCMAHHLQWPGSVAKGSWYYPSDQCYLDYRIVFWVLPGPREDQEGCFETKIQWRLRNMVGVYLVRRGWGSWACAVNNLKRTAIKVMLPNSFQ